MNTSSERRKSRGCMSIITFNEKIIKVIFCVIIVYCAECLQSDWLK